MVWSTRFCTEVADIVRTVPHSCVMLAAAYLHDTVDDVPSVTVAMLKRRFGEEVGEMVCWLSESQRPVKGNRAARKAAERTTIARAPADVQTLRLADVVSNVETIHQRDPVFARTYLPEKYLLLQELSSGDPTLRILALNLISVGMKALDIPFLKLKRVAKGC